MKICTIIPVYNSERHIRGVVERALQYIENLIIVNDGSTDGTVERLSGFL